MGLVPPERVGVVHMEPALPMVVFRIIDGGPTQILQARPIDVDNDISKIYLLVVSRHVFGLEQLEVVVKGPLCATGDCNAG